ncbi:MAG: hypothetical protein Q9163_002038 [Psora crenata]
MDEAGAVKQCSKPSEAVDTSLSPDIANDATPSPSYTVLAAIRGNRQLSPTPSITTSTRSHDSCSQKFKYVLMVEYLQQVMFQRRWLRDAQSATEGAFVKMRDGEYISLPASHQEGCTVLYQAAASLNAQALITIRSPVVEKFLEFHPDAVDAPLTDSLRVQILSSYADLRRAKVHQYAAFIASEMVLVVWDDDALHIEGRASKIISDLTKMIWSQAMNLGEKNQGKSEDMGDSDSDGDVQKANVQSTQKRRTQLINSTLAAMTLCLIVIFIGAGIRELAIECAVDYKYGRLGLLLIIPLQIFFTLFFVQVVVGCFSQIFGPTQQMKQNSCFYSAQTSPRLKQAVLPHVTIQCPVYKEDLEATIAPTVRSIKAAISTYELQGGSANMLINDDGLQALDYQAKEARLQFYADHKIGWTARPNHNAILRDGTRFVKKGKFKKASNMNYGMMMSCRIEQILAQVERSHSWTQKDEDATYDEAFEQVLTELPDAWASGNIRIGDYILIVDSDTRIPSDCFLDAVSEMNASPEVGILQFNSGVMQVQHDYFENGITFFTNLIYSAIRYTVANGDVAPFVGHNALLRWSAIQQVSYVDEDGYEKFWSESHVSEDFDMSLRLQCNNYIIRLANWAGDGFKEGVSLTVYDELARWEKYAFGCNELLFRPIYLWWRHGPFTPLFKKFLRSNIRFTSKVSIISYIGTYYAIGAAWIMTIVNYFLIGWFNGYLDKYYLDSWKVWFSLVLVFNGLGNVGLAAMRYRDEDTRDKSGGRKIAGFFGHLFTNLKWTFLLSIFLGGLSLHVSSALLAHLFGYNMTWGATAKEAKVTNFFQEAPVVLRRFKWSFMFSIVGILIMVVLGTGLGGLIRHDWRIQSFVALLPLSTLLGSHLLLPIVLNPGLMTFSY